MASKPISVVSVRPKIRAPPPFDASPALPIPPKVPKTALLYSVKPTIPINVPRLNIMPVGVSGTGSPSSPKRNVILQSGNQSRFESLEMNQSESLIASSLRSKSLMSSLQSDSSSSRLVDIELEGQLLPIIPLPYTVVNVVSPNGIDTPTLVVTLPDIANDVVTVVPQVEPNYPPGSAPLGGTWTSKNSSSTLIDYGTPISVPSSLLTGESPDYDSVALTSQTLIPKVSSSVVKSQMPIIQPKSSVIQRPIIPIQAKSPTIQRPIAPIQAKSPTIQRPIAPIQAKSPTIQRPIVSVQAKSPTIQRPIVPIQTRSPIITQPMVQRSVIQRPIVSVQPRSPIIQRPIVPVSIIRPTLPVY